MKRVSGWGAVAALVVMAPALAQDLAVSAGSQAKVLLDNDEVRVLELVTQPGAKTGVHSHGDHFVYFVTDGAALLAIVLMVSATFFGVRSRSW